MAQKMAETLLKKQDQKLSKNQIKLCLKMGLKMVQKMAETQPKKTGSKALKKQDQKF